MATIEFTEEQSMLLETAVDFCRKNSPLDGVRRQIELDDSVDAGIWAEMADLGWLGITIPEQYGGLGLSLADVVPIVESMGRHLMGSPYAYLPCSRRMPWWFRVVRRRRIIGYRRLLRRRGC